MATMPIEMILQQYLLAPPPPARSVTHTIEVDHGHMMHDHLACRLCSRWDAPEVVPDILAITRDVARSGE
jgi:HD-like signal output (HDOD) protein